MDDFNVATLNEGRSEWCARLLNVLTPAIIQGMRAIFDEAYSVCSEDEQYDQYLVAFQTFLSRVPQWNNEIIADEKARVEKVSGCTYLEDIITCVHVIQLKALACVRVGQLQKKIDIDVPDTNGFIHKVYTNAARRLYTNVYLFERDIPPLEQQKNARELEKLVQESILQTVRDSVPVEEILKAYISATTEELDDEAPMGGAATDTADPDELDAAASTNPGKADAAPINDSSTPDGPVEEEAVVASLPATAPPAVVASLPAAAPPAVVAGEAVDTTDDPPGADEASNSHPMPEATLLPSTGEDADLAAEESASCVAVATEPEAVATEPEAVDTPLRVGFSPTVNFHTVGATETSGPVKDEDESLVIGGVVSPPTVTPPPF